MHGIDIIKQNNEKLLQCARRGDVFGCKALLGLLSVNLLDINYKDQNYFTPLHSAAKEGHAEIVKLLLEKGADSNACNKDGFTPLHSAAKEGHAEIVKLLLEKGADSNACNKDGFTPLHSAVKEGHAEIVKLLLEKRADPDTMNEYGLTPLISAIIASNDLCAGLLVMHGASLKMKKSIHGMNALHFAAQRCSKDLFDSIFMSDVDDQYIGQKDNNGNTVLHHAIQYSQGDCIDFLDDVIKTTQIYCSGCLVAKNKEGKTPTDLAIEKNRNDVAFLIQRAITRATQPIPQSYLNFASCDPIAIYCKQSM